MATQERPQKISAWSIRRIVSVDFLEDVLFVASTLFAFYFAWLIATQGGNWALRLLWLFLTWPVIAYLAMPRLNRLLTNLYVPDYFFGRTRAGDGVLGDPVNLAVLGTEDQLRTAMERAGWIMSHPITLRSSWAIVVSSLTGRSYPEAPVSSLFLFRNQQDFAYQQEVDGNARQRHHVRFWRCPPGWILPGGHRVDWLAAGTYDRSVGLSMFTLQITHKIDADTDVERDHIVKTVTDAVPEASVDVIRNFSTGYHSRNGGGDAIHTDGDLPVLRLEGVPAEPQPPLRPAADDADVGARPVSVVVAVLLSVATTVLSLVRAMFEFVAVNPDGDSLEVRVILAGVLAVMGILLVILALQTYRGRAWARLTTLVLAALTLVGYLGVTTTTLLSMVDMGLALGVLYALTSDSARQWTGRVPVPDLPGFLAD